MDRTLEHVLDGYIQGMMGLDAIILQIGFGATLYCNYIRSQGFGAWGGGVHYQGDTKP